MEETDKPEWFRTWFGSPFYAILYRDRNEEEARILVKRLVKALELPDGARVLDLACGSGRHAAALAECGFDVTGIDLSSEAIEKARHLTSPRLHFLVMDMRDFRLEKPVQAVFNLFTSFGYFGSRQDNLAVLQSIYQVLEPGGQFVLDFLNAGYLLSATPCSENLTIDGNSFEILKFRENGFVVKEISVRGNNREHRFTERVQLLTLEDFQQLFQETGFQLVHTFGSYSLDRYEPETSSRLIMIATRP